MKKIYQTPAITVRNIKPANIVCVSFGSGNTGAMHAKQSPFDLDLGLGLDDAVTPNLEGTATSSIFTDDTSLIFDE